MKIYESVSQLYFSDSSEIDLAKTNLELYNVHFLLNGLAQDTTVTFYDFLGNVNSELTITEPTEFDLKFVSLKKIIISDSTYVYSFFLTKQMIVCNNEQEFAELFLQQKMDITNMSAQTLAKDTSLTPLGNLQFDSSKRLKMLIDAQTSNLATDIGAGNLFAKDTSLTPLGNLQFDSSKRLKMLIDAQTSNLATDIGAGNLFAKDTSLANVRSMKVDTSGNQYHVITGQSRDTVPQQQQTQTSLANGASINHDFAPAANMILTVEAVMALALYSYINDSTHGYIEVALIYYNGDTGFSLNLFSMGVGSNTLAQASGELYADTIQNTNVNFTAGNNIYWNNRQGNDTQAYFMMGTPIRLTLGWKLEVSYHNDSGYAEYLTAASTIRGLQTPQ